MILAVATFGAGLLVGQSPDRKAKSADPASDCRPPAWADPITVRRGHEAPATLTPHHIYTHGENAVLSQPSDPTADIWTVTYDSGRVVVAYTAPK